MSKNRINEQLKNIQKAKEELPTANKSDLIQGLIQQEDEAFDLDKIAKELQERQESESVGENDGFVKDTIYIRKDIYDAFNALCVKRGDKKKFANEALKEFVIKKYKELKENN